MTNEELLDDLKQFVGASIRQKVAPLAEKVDSKLDTVQQAIGEALESIDHTGQVRRLEERLAVVERVLRRRLAWIVTP